MKKLLLASALLGGALLASVSPAAANVIYSWTLSGIDNGSGQLTTDGSNNIISLSGMIDGAAVTLAGGDPGGPTTSTDGQFIYDNILYPNGTAPGLLDIYGILLSSVAFGSANIFGDGTTGLPGTYAYYVFTPGQGYTTANGSGDTFAVVAPEPSALALMGVALLSLFGLGLMRRRADTYKA